MTISKDEAMAICALFGVLCFVVGVLVGKQLP
jgi:hypothetical protein